MPNDASDKYITNRNPTARISPIFRDGDVLALYSATTRISPVFRDGDATNGDQNLRTICDAKRA